MSTPDKLDHDDSAQYRIYTLLANASWQMGAAAGAVGIVLGILVLAWPGISLVAAAAVFGAYLLVSGVFQLGAAFGHHIPAHLRALAFISGAFSLLFGLICFRGPAQSILLLALWIGFGWLLRGVTTVATALSNPKASARGLHVMLGVASAVAGVVVISSPFGSIATLTVVSGLWLVVLGVIELVHSINHAIAERPARSMIRAVQ